MIVQCIYSGAIGRGVQMAGTFLYDGREHPAGDVILMIRGTRRCVSAAAFQANYIELSTDTPVPSEEARG